MSRLADHFPAWTHTVIAMKRARDAKPDHFAVRVRCDRCNQGRDVDLDAIVAAKGEDHTLIDKRYRCKLTPGCEGWNAFHFQSGVMRPLWTQDQADRWIYQDDNREHRMRAARAYIGAVMSGKIIRTDPAPVGVAPTAWAIANDGERKRLIRRARD